MGKFYMASNKPILAGLISNCTTDVRAEVVTIQEFTMCKIYVTWLRTHVSVH